MNNYVARASTLNLRFEEAVSDEVETSWQIYSWHGYGGPGLRGYDPEARDRDLIAYAALCRTFEGRQTALLYVGR